MTSLDLTIMACYLLGLLFMGAMFMKMNNTHEMFAAGGKSPWWLSSLSAFMTTFSAGTFVVWGGIAYKHGMVGVWILIVIGISAILVGKFLAGTWKNYGYDSAAEFITDRFGRSLVQFYAWVQGMVGIFTIGGTIYALAVIVAALIELPEGHLLADPATGHLSVTLASLVLCVVVILITSGGGLWAVLMTDALQFIILVAAVLAVVPLILLKVGGVGEFAAQVPEGFFKATAGDFTWVFLAGWSLVFCFKLGGEWAYVQRFACVPTAKDARKSSYLFGILYLVSPLIWMIPPMVYRVINPNANPEEAYILACQVVLPAGMMGLMVAAMASATASSATTLLNVYAGAFTTELYRDVFRPRASEKELVIAGRIITVLLGGVAISGALLIPRLGTYTNYILASVAILTGPIVLPTLWGLFSKKIGLGTAWTVTSLGLVVSVLVKFGFGSGGWFEKASPLQAFTDLVQKNERISELAVGTIVPIGLLLIAELIIRQENPGWERVNKNKTKYVTVEPSEPSTLPARICSWSTIGIGAVMLILSLTTTEDRLIIALFGTGLAAIGATILYISKRMSNNLSY